MQDSRFRYASRKSQRLYGLVSGQVAFQPLHASFQAGQVGLDMHVWKFKGLYSTCVGSHDEVRCFADTWLACGRIVL